MILWVKWKADGWGQPSLPGVADSVGAMEGGRLGTAIPAEGG
ncbi:MAG: hypothetical protein AB8D78_11900 [Akkermansiaceae bacterium]